MAGADFEGNSTAYYAKHFKVLLAFINEHFNVANTILGFKSMSGNRSFNRHVRRRQ